MTDDKTIATRVGAVFAATFHLEAPRADTDLIDNGILDSFQFIELLVQLECEFGLRIELSDIDLDDLRTLERIADLVARSSATPDAEPRTPRSAAAR